MNRRQLLQSLLTGGAVLAGGAIIPPMARKIFLPPRCGWPGRYTIAFDDWGPHRVMTFDWTDDPRKAQGLQVVVDDVEGFNSFRAAGGRYVTVRLGADGQLHMTADADLGARDYELRLT